MYPQRTISVGRVGRVVALGAAGLIGAGLLTACEPAAETFTVTTTVDAVDATIGDGICATAAGQCSVRAAVQEGNANAETGPIEVVLPEGIFELTITGAGEDAAATGDLDLTRRFRFRGAGMDAGGIDPVTLVTGGGSATDRVFDVHPGAGLEVSDLNLSLGSADVGGIVRAVGADVSATRVTMQNGTATGAGGIVSSDGGTVTLTDSQLVQGAAAAGGGIAADRLVATRTLFYMGTATTGAAILLTDASTASTIDTSSIARNNATGGHVVAATAGAQLTIRDSSFAESASTGGQLSGGPGTSVGNSVMSAEVSGPDCGAPVVSLGGNLERATSCGFTAAGDRQSTEVQVRGFVVTPTVIAIEFDSTFTVDAGTGCLATDAALVARPADGDGDGVAECDRGALESVLQPRTHLVTSGADDVDLLPGDGQCTTSIGACTLRAAIQETNAWPTADEITIKSGVSVVLTRSGRGEDAAATGDLDITDDVTIAAGGTALASIDANDIDRIFDVVRGSATFDTLLVTDGTEPAGGGGIRVFSKASATILRTSVLSNVGSTGGGGGILSGGTLTIDRSLVRLNSGGAQGGGLLVVGKTTTVLDSTFANNTATTGSAISSLTGATATVKSSTIASNTTGAALQDVGAISLQNSIVSGNAAGNCTSSVVTFGHNIDSGTTCGLNGTGDVSSTNPALGTLSVLGSPTQSIKPNAGSPAIGTGVCTSAVDQRGTSRPQGGACDKGSVEQ